ncbi:MAG: toxin-antitoxin system HicB family antitoxin [Planctomycetes bacterium]|nr:toxin-antitoxin system HicB family antitoxin [Planctomycetota bacterium]
MVKRYTYTIAWEDEDGVFVGRVLEFPSLAAHGTSAEKALQEIQKVVRQVIADLEEHEEDVPEPRSLGSFSGRFNLRIPSSLHRHLSVEASREGVSLNQLVLSKLRS